MLIFWCDLGQERLEGGASPAVGLKDSRGDDSGSVFCSLLALRVVHKDFDVCTEAGPSRNVRNFVSQSVVSRGEGVSAWACRRVFAFLVKGGTALGAVALLVFASIAVIAHGSA